MPAKVDKSANGHTGRGHRRATAESPAELHRQIQGWVKEGSKPRSVGTDGFPVYERDPLADVQEQLTSYLKQAARRFEFWKVKPETLPAGKVLINLSADETADVMRALMVRLLYWKSGEAARNQERQANVLDFNELMQLVNANLKGTQPKIKKLEREAPDDPVYFRTLISQLLRSESPFTADDLATLVDLVADQNLVDPWYPIPSDAALASVERHAKKSEPTPALRAQLERWHNRILKRNRPHSAERKALTRLKELLGREEKTPIQAGEAWSDAALVDLKQMPAELRDHWKRLIRHCKTAESSKPAQKWLKEANALIEPLGRDEFKTRVIRWFELVALPRPIHQPPAHATWAPDPDQLITDGNSVILKGMAWCCAGWGDQDVSRALSTLAEVCFKKVRWLGPRCPRVGNACLYSLSVTPSDDAAAQLSRLDQRVKQPTAKKLIGKSLNKAAELTGQTREDLEESTVPTYGLDAEGRLTQAIGGFTAEFSITGPEALETIWHKAGSKTQKSVPAEVKSRHADDLKKFKRSVQDLEKMLPAQRTRIERLLVSERIWPLDKWRERYLIHPLLSPFVRRLIWHFRLGDRTALATWHEGKLVDVRDRPLDWLAPETQVRIWHPLGFEVDTVAAWRRWLEERQVVQPFKQAHREIYVLTGAEQRTATYSNRFAAHIIRQHQFAALARERGWKYALMGGFDFQSTPTLELPRWGLKAEFWVDTTGGRNDASESGISLYLATDQVRFVREETAVPLLEVPATVFSEVMRDVDLFVGVCSVGNDPAWRDRGQVEGGETYWQHYSFGELSASASTRKDILERLIPRLKIAGQCSLSSKFLVVKGQLRTYKIHLGSSNILMEPNDQYLCIVPGRDAGRARDAFLLPFEGDPMLSIILSKAFLLADDAKIKDATILRQIRSDKTR